MSSTSGHDDRPGVQEHGGNGYGASGADVRHPDPLDTGRGDAQRAYEEQHHPVSRPVNGAAVASLVLGIAAILTSFVVIGLLLGVLGLVLGVIGLRRVRRGEAGRRGMAVTGVVLSVLGIVLGVVSTIAWVGFLFSNDPSGCVQRYPHSAAAQQQCDGT